MFKRKFSFFMAVAVLASSLLFGCDSTGNGELMLASIADGQLTITYSKDFPDCVYLLNDQNQVTHTQDFYCQEGAPTTVAKPLSDFNGLSIGDKVKLCHGQDNSLCSDSVTIMNGSSLDYDPAVFATDEESTAVESENPRILLVGDSWAYVINYLRILDSVLVSHSSDFRNIVIDYNDVGEQAWQVAGQMDEIKAMLNDNPTVDIVILSIGGNDLMYSSDVSCRIEITPDGKEIRIPNMSDAAREEVIDGIKNNIQTIANDILAVRSDIKLLILSYDYPNFDESLNWPMDLLASHYIFGENGINGDETTTAREVNDFVIMLGEAQWQIACGNERIYFQNNLGLMQWKFGYLKHFIFPRKVPLPVATSCVFSAGGNPEFYSPPRGMLHIIPLWADANHLSYEGYRFIMEKAYDEHLEDWLMNE